MALSRDRYNAFCAALPATTHVVQWGGADVWKVAGKVFAIGHWNGAAPAVTFKVSPLAYEVLKDQAGLRPAPYLASRGMTWIQHFAPPGMADEDLLDHLRASHEIVARGLPKRLRMELGV